MMSSAITPIAVRIMFNFTVNCYLVRLDVGFILVDTGTTGQRRRVETALREAGCQPGDLKLTILTHGDFDHCGNAAYLRDTFGAPIALHDGDRGMVERGDMFWNRPPPNAIVKALSGLLLKLDEKDRFSPDVILAEGDDFAAYGFDAEAIHLPGHSLGSVGILTGDGVLFCGDLLGNTRQPALWTLIDDEAAAHASLDKLHRRAITTVYPGHGQPFAGDQLPDVPGG